MRTIDAMALILKKEGIEFLSAFPTTSVIEAIAATGVRPVICRQERVGVHIADGFARVTNGRKASVFAMQYGPGAENAYPGVATAFSDSVPMLFLPLGHPSARESVTPMYSSLKSYDSVTKHIERINSPERVGGSLRRAFSAMRLGKPGPAMLEIPADIAEMEVDGAVVDSYVPVKTAISGADEDDVMEAAKALVDAKRPLILAGQGVMYAEASDELTELAELLQVAVSTTMAGKSAFSEMHPLSVGSVSEVMNGAGLDYMRESDVLFGIGTSFTIQGMVTPYPSGKIMIHATNDPIDLHKDYIADHPLLGDARIVLRQMIDACKELVSTRQRETPDTADRISALRSAWYGEWESKLSSSESPITPYRVLGEFMSRVDPSDAIVTHDSGSPRMQIMPFYRSDGPRSYLGWGKSHGLGTGLGLIMGAKLAKPEKFCVNFMGDAAFGMTGLDFETAVRSNIPICTVVLNNDDMAVEVPHMELSNDRFGSRALYGRYADMARAMGGWSERVDDPNDVGPALERARKATEDGNSALLEFVTSSEMAKSNLRAFS
ncbi:MAG TPA: thiamine pyrophosphate-requiring protein [Dehalococcoidia bacterium]|nr:thiamine pyrophosphate-requiring protein [Dehalococcoidia bacterium]